MPNCFAKHELSNYTWTVNTVLQASEDRNSFLNCIDKQTNTMYRANKRNTVDKSKWQVKITRFTIL